MAAADGAGDSVAAPVSPLVVEEAAAALACSVEVGAASLLAAAGEVTSDMVVVRERMGVI